MPNWCFNSVRIKVKRAEDIQEIISAVRGEWLFQHFVPWSDEVRKDYIIECIFGYNWAEVREKLKSTKDHRQPMLDWKEEWFEQCPYTQKWYHWQINNWWAKRDFVEENFTPDEEGELEIWFSYDSPWSPHLEWREKISERLKCEIWLSFDEPGCCFSWERHWIDWDLVEYDDYDDAYYWNWKECEICWWTYDLSNPEDWYEQADFVWGTGKRNICVNCWEDLKYWKWKELD